jgi:NAD(P)-dependent dehydrogenase (short-subunit alcohol dehydrogenase family)
VTERFADRIVLVTGGTSGIGRATALAFAKEGATVAIAGRDRARGEAVALECGRDAVFLQADLAAAKACADMVAATVLRFGRIDIAFNNAGFQERRAPLHEQSDAVYDQVFDTNLRAVFLLMKAEIAAMLPQGRGAIVNNASVSGVRNPNPGLSLYSASKAAAISLTRSAAMEYAPQGIRINAVSPGRVETPMMLASGIADMSAVAAGLPLRRLGTPEEVAMAVLFLASDEAAFVVGQNLGVDGGFLSS